MQSVPDRSDEMRKVRQKPFSKPKKELMSSGKRQKPAKAVVEGSNAGCSMLETRVEHEEPFRAFLVRHARRYRELAWGGMDVQEVLEELMSKDLIRLVARQP